MLGSQNQQATVARRLRYWMIAASTSPRTEWNMRQYSTSVRGACAGVMVSSLRHRRGASNLRTPGAVTSESGGACSPYLRWLQAIATLELIADSPARASRKCGIINISGMLPFTALEDQIRECFGRVVYTHKTHEKMAEDCATALRNYKWAQIFVSAL